VDWIVDWIVEIPWIGLWIGLWKYRGLEWLYAWIIVGITVSYGRIFAKINARFEPKKQIDF
jgi:hypothetical protein